MAAALAAPEEEITGEITVGTAEIRGAEIRGAETSGCVSVTVALADAEELTDSTGAIGARGTRGAGLMNGPTTGLIIGLATEPPTELDALAALAAVTVVPCGA